MRIVICAWVMHIMGHFSPVQVSYSQFSSDVLDTHWQLAEALK